MTVADLDGFRDAYSAGSLTWAEHRRFYDEVIYPVAPDQNYSSPRLVNEFLAWADPVTVYELGGWDGHLARQVMTPSIVSWLNVEVADVPQICGLPGYERVIPDDWPWREPIRADAFVASHVLEHLTEAHLTELLDVLDCEYAYVDVPLGEERTSWASTTTTHVLPLSIGEFDGLWESRGWMVERRYFRDEVIPSQVRFYGR